MGFFVPYLPYISFKTKFRHFPVFLTLITLTPAFVYPLADIRYILYTQKKDWVDNSFNQLKSPVM